MQPPRLFTKHAAEAPAGQVPRAPKPVVTRAYLGLEGQDMTKLPDRGQCRSMEPGGTACWQGCYQKVTICEKQAGVDRKTNLTLAIFIFVGVDKPLANWPRVVEVESVHAFLCLFGMCDPPHKKSRQVQSHSALAKLARLQGNTQRALGQTQDAGAKDHVDREGLH